MTPARSLSTWGAPAPPSSVGGMSGARHERRDVRRANITPTPPSPIEGGGLPDDTYVGAAVPMRVIFSECRAKPTPSLGEGRVGVMSAPHKPRNAKPGTQRQRETGGGNARLPTRKPVMGTA